MSWNKNTVDCSALDSIRETLESLGVPYQLETKIRAMGLGLNDDEDKVYELRRLQYGAHVILEQMIRTSDCDMDDTIISQRFPLLEEPLDWEYETKIDNQ